MSATEPLRDKLSPLGEVRENSSRDGAFRIAMMIEAYWRARGRIVNTRVIPVGCERGVRYDVRSDLHNGMPKPLALKLVSKQ